MVAQACVMPSYVDQYSTDPLFSYVTLLLHGEGSNGSTTITDSSSGNRATNTQDPQVAITTAQFKFGAASLGFGTGGGFRYSYTSLILPNTTGNPPAGDDWTWESWIRPTNAAGSYQALLYLSAALTANSVGVYLKNNTLLWYEASADHIPSAASIANNVQTHVAVSKTSGVMRTFVAGVDTGTTFSAANLAFNELMIGASNGFGQPIQEAFAGTMDDVRITSRFSRYPGGNFTPPVAQFPDH